MAERRHTIVVLLENKDGILSRITSLFSARGYVMESLCLGPTLDPSVARMVIIVRGNEQVIEQVIKQLQKLIEVIKVGDLTDVEHVEREMILVRVRSAPEDRAEVVRIADIFRARIVDVTASSYTLEVTGDGSKLDGILDLLRPFGIQEVVRTGKIALARGRREKPLATDDLLRRRYPRLPAAFEVRLASVSALAKVWAHDISQGGMSLRTDREIPLGTTMRLRFVHPHTGEAFPLDAVVRRHIATPSFRGVGVEFVALDDERRERLERFIRSELGDEQLVDLADEPSSDTSSGNEAELEPVRPDELCPRGD